MHNRQMPKHSPTVFALPAALTLETTLAACVAIASAKEASEFVFDFGNVVHVEPFPMLLLSSEIAALRMRFPDASFVCRRHEKMTYAAHMGFFRSFAVEFGKHPGQATGSSSYVPMTLFNCEDLEREATQRSRALQEEIEDHSKRLAEVLCKSTTGAMFDTLAYSMREIMRNVVEHSKSARFGICAQYWPSKNRVEVAILDRGIGVQQSIQHNPHIDASDDKRALNYALMPAVSGTAFRGARRQSKGPWVNSGFGLYMTNRICRNGGNFFIASGDTGMLLTSKGEGKRYYPAQLSGTAVRMVIRTKEIMALDEALATYRREGYAIQRRYAEIVNIDPSAASLMLSKDFDLPLWERLLATLKGRQ